MNAHSRITMGRVTLALFTLAPFGLTACSQSSNPDSGSAGAVARNPVQPDPSELHFEQRLDLFDADPIPATPKYFDMVLGDMDLDGDLDCFLNRHNLHRFEAFENVGGSFEQINRRAGDRSGLWDNRGIPDLYARPLDITPVIDARGIPGVYVWHAENLSGRWFLRVVPGPGVTTQSLRVTTNRPLVDQFGLSEGEIERISDVEVQVDVDVSGGARNFAFGNLGINTQLKVKLEDGAPTGLFAGTNFLEFQSGEVSLWKQDPHGMALVDCMGSAHPDLYISGGGLAGSHLPPHDPQADRLFESLAEPGRYREVPDGVLPADYGRGRQVMWVDMDADGENELYVANKETPNLLLERGPNGEFGDSAPGLGLDFVGPDAFAWLDLDGDGDLDLVFLEGNEIMVAYRRGSTFLTESGTAVGLELPPEVSGTSDLFEAAGFQLLDMDRDGDLDLWVMRHTSDNLVAVFRNDGSYFVRVTGELGLDAITGLRQYILADIDNDGWIDCVAYGSRITWWRNLLGESFVPELLDADFANPVSNWISAGDVDLDGRIDMVVMTASTRQVLQNETEGPNTLLEVLPDLPLGTIIRAYHPDGTVYAQSWGSATVTRYSQMLQPLRFGQAPGVPVIELGVQLPGDAQERYRVNVPPGTRRLDL